jgi:hypothetical protein
VSCAVRFAGIPVLHRRIPFSNKRSKLRYIGEMTADLSSFLRSLTDERLKVEIALEGEKIRLRQSRLAAMVAELAERDRRAAEAAGRSAKAGPYDTARAVQQLTGFTRHEVRGLVEVGALMAPADEGSATPWLSGLADSAREGVLSVTKAQVIRAGLGSPTEVATVEDLALAANHLVEVGVGMTPEQLERETRAVREQLDAQVVVDEERRIQGARSVKLWVHRDGSGTLMAKLDRESTVVVAELLDNATGPRRSGPRFTTPEGEAYQQGVNDDPRSTEQLAHDAIFTIIKLGLAANPNRIPGRRPAVRVIVTQRDQLQRTGYGELEGKGQTVSLETIDRYLCDSGTLQISIDSRGKPLNHGTEQRLFTDAQRTALSIRDGQCMDDCDRPASWCEVHHIIHHHSGGPTTLENGILLCRYHHLDLHNRHAWIEYDHQRSVYVMCEPDGRRRDLESKARIQETHRDRDRRLGMVAVVGVAQELRGCSGTRAGAELIADPGYEQPVVLEDEVDRPEVLGVDAGDGQPVDRLGDRHGDARLGMVSLACPPEIGDHSRHVPAGMVGWRGENALHQGYRELQGRCVTEDAGSTLLTVDEHRPAAEVVVDRRLGERQRLLGWCIRSGERTQGKATAEGEAEGEHGQHEHSGHGGRTSRRGHQTQRNQPVCGQ